MSELKPCPFCGAQPNEPEIDQVDAVTWGARIDCSGCDASFSDQYGEKSPDMAVIAVVTLWNRRTPASEGGRIRCPKRECQFKVARIGELGTICPADRCGMLIVARESES
ncbi:Lar family restriction alleviation protein [Burkholderia vietnamiensis]